MPSDLSESSDNEDEYDDGTGDKNINYDGDGNGIVDRNTGVVGGSTEWLRFLSPSAQTEALRAMAKAKASLLTALRRNRIWKKVKVK